jgi:hypothetical protein
MTDAVPSIAPSSTGARVIAPPVRRQPGVRGFEVHKAGDHWTFVGRAVGGELLDGVPLLSYPRTYAPWPPR